MKKTAALWLGLFLFVPVSASASFLFAEEDLTIVIPLNDDTYAAGGTVVVQEDVDGDLYLAGGDVTVKGTVKQDLIVAGGDVTLGGTIGDDARILAGKVFITSTVEDDLIILGGDVTLLEGSHVKGDVRVLGGDVVVDGMVDGNLHVRGGSLKFSGSIGGDVDVRTETLRFNGHTAGNAVLAAKDFNISNTAHFEQDVHYWQPEGVYYFAGATVEGKSAYDEDLALKAFDSVKKTALDVFKAGLIAIAGFSLLSASLLIFLMILTTKTYFVDGANRLKKAPGLSLWYGFLYLLVTPVIALAFCATIIGIPIGLFIAVLYLFTVFYAHAFASVLYAKWLQLRYKKNWSTFRLFLASVGIYVLLRVVSLIPLLGTFAISLLVLMMFGALAHTEYVKYKKVC